MCNLIVAHEWRKVVKASLTVQQFFGNRFGIAPPWCVFYLDTESLPSVWAGVGSEKARGHPATDRRKEMKKKCPKLKSPKHQLQVKKTSGHLPHTSFWSVFGVCLLLSLPSGCSPCSCCGEASPLQTHLTAWGSGKLLGRPGLFAAQPPAPLGGLWRRATPTGPDSEEIRESNKTNLHFSFVYFITQLKQKKEKSDSHLKLSSTDPLFSITLRFNGRFMSTSSIVKVENTGLNASWLISAQTDESIWWERENSMK